MYGKYMESYLLLYYAIPKEIFQTDGRIFLKNEMHPVYSKNGSSILVAENGEIKEI